jgi:hypothetical protein
MHGTPKTSYDKLDKTRMIIRHSKHVDENIPGARSRNISCIFIENAQGERFRFPYNYLKGARAMMMHVAKGGNAYDEIGESIVKKVEEIKNLRNFNSYTIRSGLLDETTQPFVEAAKDKIKEAKKTLEQLAKAHTYDTALESLKTTDEDLSEEQVEKLKQKFTKETFDDSILDAFKHLPVNELKDDDDEEVDVMTLPSSATRYKNYVDTWLQQPDSKLILKKDDSYDKFQNNLRGQMKDTEQKLGAIMRDIATRFLSPETNDDAIVNFASDMDQELSKSGELFSKPNPEIKKLKSTAIKLANKYLQDMKKMQADDEYADEVRKSPEDVKAFKNIKGQNIDKGKLTKQYKRKYKDESEQFEAWVDSQLDGLGVQIEEDDIVASEYEDAFKNVVNELLEDNTLPPSGTYIHTPQNLILKPDGDSIWDDEKDNPSEVPVTKIEIGFTNNGPDEIYHFMGVYHNTGTWELYTDNGITRQLAEYFGVRDGDIDWSEQGEQEETMMHFDISTDQIAGQLIKSMNRKFTAESGIMYRAGVKKYGKAGMKAIQSAAGKGASAEEIGAIKDKHNKKKVKELDEDQADKEKWLRYAKFWKYIRDVMAQEAEADIGDGFISADSIDEEPSYTTAKEIMQRAMAKQNTPWNDSIIDSDLDEYSSELNQDYEDKTDFADMKKAAIEMITTGKTQIVPYGTYPPMDQMNYSAEDTTDIDINDIVRLSGIK